MGAVVADTEGLAVIVVVAEDLVDVFRGVADEDLGDVLLGIFAEALVMKMSAASVVVRVVVVDLVLEAAYAVVQDANFDALVVESIAEAYAVNLKKAAAARQGLSVA